MFVDPEALQRSSYALFFVTRIVSSPNFTLKSAFENKLDIFVTMFKSFVIFFWFLGLFQLPVKKKSLTIC